MKNITKVLNKIIEIILNIIICLVSIVVIIALIYVVQTKVLNYKSANIFGYTAFEVITGSMSPTIEIGDIVVVKITKDINPNDIAVYIQDDNFITHRIISINGEDIVTRGDANNSQDSPITKSDIFGKVIFTIPDVSIWRKVILTPEVLIGALITIVLLGLTLRIDNTNANENNESEKNRKERK